MNAVNYYIIIVGYIISGFVFSIFLTSSLSDNNFKTHEVGVLWLVWPAWALILVLFGNQQFGAVWRTCVASCLGLMVLKITRDRGKGN